MAQAVSSRSDPRPARGTHDTHRPPAHRWHRTPPPPRSPAVGAPWSAITRPPPGVPPHGPPPPTGSPPGGPAPRTPARPRRRPRVPPGWGTRIGAGDRPRPCSAAAPTARPETVGAFKLVTRPADPPGGGGATGGSRPGGPAPAPPVGTPPSGAPRPNFRPAPDSGNPFPKSLAPTARPPRSTPAAAPKAMPPMPSPRRGRAGGGGAPGGGRPRGGGGAGAGAGCPGRPGLSRPSFAPLSPGRRPTKRPQNEPGRGASSAPHAKALAARSPRAPGNPATPATPPAPRPPPNRRKSGAAAKSPTTTRAAGRLSEAFARRKP